MASHLLTDLANLQESNTGESQYSWDSEADLQVSAAGELLAIPISKGQSAARSSLHGRHAAGCRRQSEECLGRL